MSCFEKGYPKIQLFRQVDGQSGLYENQIGAIGAALSHFSTRSVPELITMPTGTGKTAVMIVLSLKKESFLNLIAKIILDATLKEFYSKDEPPE